MAAFALLIGWIASGFLASSIASKKGWSGVNWFLAGFLFGPIGLIAATGLPDRRLRTYLRHLASKQGWTEQSDSLPQAAPGGGEDADAQRRRILGGNS